MPVTPGPSRRFVFLLVTVSALLAIIFVTSFRSGIHAGEQPNPHSHLSAQPQQQQNQPPSTLPSTPGPNTAILPKLGNETLKAELGNAAWKLLHTTLARFPDTPTADEQTALRTYLHLFQRLYPCGECAQHFGQILAKFPPQVSSRSAAAAWGCHVHNEVNVSLGKEVWDCNQIGDFYDCGCAEDDDEGEKMDGDGSGKAEISEEQKDRLTGASGSDVAVDHLIGGGRAR